MALATQINHCADFAEAMQSYGLALEEGAIDDGQIHRFRVNGDKAGSLTGWYVLFRDDIPAGRFGCWKRGIDETWCSKEKQQFTSREREVHKRCMQKLRAEREKEKKRAQSEAAVKCQELWNKAEPANPQHLYLASKGVSAYGIRQIDNSMLVPVRNQEGVICSLQFINQEGSKRFKSGGQISGCYHSIGKRTDQLYLCEGYATGATIHEITDCGVIVAFNAGNLKSVAEIIKEKYPDRVLIIAADNDTKTKGNPGLTKARATAQELGLEVAYPSFEQDEVGSDFNDYGALRGIEATRIALEPVPQQEPSKEIGGNGAEDAVNSQPLDEEVEITRLARLWGIHAG